ncbi:MAG: redoxin domain-containing protein [Eubacteriales bacterium]
MKTIKRILAVVMAVAMLFALVGCGKTQTQENANDNNSKQTEDKTITFPEFEGKDFEGNKVDQTLFAENDVTLLNFWFNGCSACVSEMPGLEKFNEKLREKGAQIVGVNVEIINDAGVNEEKLDEAKGIISKQGVTYRNIFVESGDAAKKYISGIFSYPTTVLVDKNGNIIGEPILGAIDGEKRMKEILNIIDDIKAGKKAPNTVSSSNPKDEEIVKLMAEENALFEEHQAAWNKVFANVQKDNIQDGAEDYAGFLKKHIEAVKGELTEEEAKVLDADIKKIEEIENKIKELKE